MSDTYTRVNPARHVPFGASGLGGMYVMAFTKREPARNVDA